MNSRSSLESTAGPDPVRLAPAWDPAVRRTRRTAGLLAVLAVALLAFSGFTFVAHPKSAYAEASATAGAGNLDVLYTSSCAADTHVLGSDESRLRAARRTWNLAATLVYVSSARSTVPEAPAAIPTGQRPAPLFASGPAAPNELQVRCVVVRLLGTSHVARYPVRPVTRQLTVPAGDRLLGEPVLKRFSITLAGAPTLHSADGKSWDGIGFTGLSHAAPWGRAIASWVAGVLGIAAAIGAGLLVLKGRRRVPGGARVGE